MSNLSTETYCVKFEVGVALNIRYLILGYQIASSF